MACPTEEIALIAALWVTVIATAVVMALVAWTFLEDVLARGKKWNC